MSQSMAGKNMMPYGQAASPANRLPAEEDHCQELCHLGAAPATTAIDDFFAPGGLLARNLPNFEIRPGQLTMARAVAATLGQAENETEAPYPCHAAPAPKFYEAAADHSELKRYLPACHLLLAEAGTGTGKTLAYLAPAVLSGRKVVISTNTINLQEQILAREIPFLRRYLAPGLKALGVKGRQNYLCLRRWHQLQASPQSHLFGRIGLAEEQKTLAELAAWLKTTSSGDRAELSSLSDDSPLWASISATADHCLGASCAHGAECFITLLRGRAARAQLLIVNHHLFFSDLALRRFGHAEVLPRYEAVIFDEAHHLENIATQHFGRSFSHYQVIDLISDLSAMAEERLPAAERIQLLQRVRSLGVESEIFFDFFPRQPGRFPLGPLIDQDPRWRQLCLAWQDALSPVLRNLEELTKVAEIWGASLRRCQELLDIFKAVTSLPNASASTSALSSASRLAAAQSQASEQNPDQWSGEQIVASDPERPAKSANFFIHWYERREKNTRLAVSPIEVAEELQKHLYQQVKAVIFSSATLRGGNDFSYVKSRLGLPADCPSLDLPSSFDYPGRTLLYVPGPDFPAPDQALYPAAARREMVELVRHSKGRALLLFTSISAMRQAAAALTREAIPYPILVQGEAPRAWLLSEFRQKTSSILLAVASFWEGVDVPGESLSCVIIDKLPFEVPSDPVIMARIAKIKADGGNPFFDFQVPRAVLTLRQGLGRLLRSDRDSGVLAILDVRLFSKGYGKIFAKSLPPSPLSRDLNEVKKFFGPNH